MKIRLALLVSALLAVFSLSAASALASGGSSFRLNNHTLESGCFMPDAYGHWGNVDIDNHLVTAKSSHMDGYGHLSEEVHITVSDGAPFSIDQVLVPGSGDGYRVVNTFDVGNDAGADDADIDPGQTAHGLTSLNRFIDENDIIVCVSDHPIPDLSSDEPYSQENDGYVSAKDRPIVAPHVTALGVSPYGGVNKFKIGFGYSVEKWYADRHRDHVLIGLGPDGRPYDAGSVNDVDESNEAWFNKDLFDGQNIFLDKSGDSTAWITRYLAQGDLPYSWSLRAALASPGRSALPV